MAKSERYQDQNWLVRRLRDTYMIMVPLLALRFWWYESRRPIEDEDDWPLTFSQCWCLSRGMVNVKQKHIYCWESEVDFEKDFPVDIEESDC